MHIHRSLTRRRLDQRLTGVAERIGIRPREGWARAIRQALGMDTVDVARRLGVTPTRVGQLERAEAASSIRLSTLHRLAVALDCELVYAFVPHEPLEHMVRRQAHRKAAAEITEEPANFLGLANHRPEDAELVEELLEEHLAARAQELVDTPGLWRPGRDPGQDQVRPPPRP